MFDFNDVTQEINNKNNDIFTDISLELLDINPCKLFYSLYGIPIIGKKQKKLKTFIIQTMYGILNSIRMLILIFVIYPSQY